MGEGKRSRKVEHVILGPFNNVIIKSHFWNSSTFASEPIINILIFIIVNINTKMKVKKSNNCS